MKDRFKPRKLAIVAANFTFLLVYLAATLNRPWNLKEILCVSMAGLGAAYYWYAVYAAFRERRVKPPAETLDAASKSI